jgi:hypothetical protein
MLNIPSNVKSIQFLNHFLLGNIRYDGEGGILGFLFNTFVRPSDKLPLDGSIFFDIVDFKNLVARGEAGKIPVQLCYSMPF